jgi:dCTP deaminase
MLIVGDNLKYLIRQYNIVDYEDSFDNTSISLRMGRTIIKMEPDVDSEDNVIYYGEEIPDKYFKEEEIANGGIVIPPKSCILASSYEKVLIPNGYFGLLQTKGSLARLFVSLTCNDGQIEPGFSGKITFEICNLSNFHIKIKPKQFVGQLFIFKTSTKQVELYNGRYQNASGPTKHQAE